MPELRATQLLGRSLERFVSTFHAYNNTAFIGQFQVTDAHKDKIHLREEVTYPILQPPK